MEMKRTKQRKNIQELMKWVYHCHSTLGSHNSGNAVQVVTRCYRRTCQGVSTSNWCNCI